MIVLLFFFFKQKTAYEMRISDWSSDVCSSDLAFPAAGDLEAGLNVVLPIASRRKGVWDALGSVNLSGQAGINHLSDFGTLYDWSMGLTWSPWDSLDLQISRIVRDVAPSLGALGNPQTINLNVPVFDFVTGERSEEHTSEL